MRPPGAHALEDQVRDRPRARRQAVLVRVVHHHPNLVALHHARAEAHRPDPGRRRSADVAHHRRIERDVGLQPLHHIVVVQAQRHRHLRAARLAPRPHRKDVGRPRLTGSGQCPGTQQQKEKERSTAMSRPPGSGRGSRIAPVVLGQKLNTLHDPRLVTRTAKKPLASSRSPAGRDHLVANDAEPALHHHLNPDAT